MACVGLSLYSGLSHPVLGLTCISLFCLSAWSIPLQPLFPGKKVQGLFPAAQQGWVQTTSHWLLGLILIFEVDLPLYVRSIQCRVSSFMDSNTCQPHRGPTSWTRCFWRQATRVTCLASRQTFFTMPLPLLSRYLATMFTLSRFIKIINFLSFVIAKGWYKQLKIRTSTYPIWTAQCVWSQRIKYTFSQFSCSVVSDSLRPRGLHHQLLEFTQTHVHWVSDAIQPSHPLLSPSPPAFSLSQHQGLFKWVSSSHQVAKVLEFH